MGRSYHKRGETLFGLGRDCFGDFRYQHWLPEIAYPTFKAICLNTLCSKFEVDIKKGIEVPVQFCLGVIPQTATGCHTNSINFVLAFFCHKCINFSLNITYITKYKNLETQTFPTICVLSRL